MSAMLAEGIWYGRGFSPKLIRFCLDGVVFDSREEGVALEDMRKFPMAIHIPLEDMRATPHGYQKFLLVEDDEEDGNLSSVLCLGFHYSNTNKKQIKVKKLFSLGKNVWRDERNNEMFIAFSCSSVLEIPFALSGFCSSTEHEEAYARQIFGADTANSSLADVKMLLRWYNPGKEIAHIALDRWMRVIFIHDGSRRSLAHGRWYWAMGSNNVAWLATHFHFEGKLKESGEPESPSTLFRSVEVSSQHSPLPKPTMYFAVGTKDAMTESLDHAFHVYASMRDHKSWHIVAQVVWQSGV
jgi:hypothetical protein